MSNPNFYLCDICGARTPEKLRLFIVTGREPDPSGNGSEDDGQYVDLCHDHAILLVKQLLKRQGAPNMRRIADHEAGKRAIELIKDEKRRQLQ